MTALVGCALPHTPIPETSRDRVEYIPVDPNPLLNTTKDRVKFRLVHHQLLADKNISVFEENGLCYLRGQVGSKTERAIAERVTRDTVGVLRVKNELEISGSEVEQKLPSKLADDDIKKIVMNTFYISKALKDAALSVDVSAGHVKIYGTSTQDDLASIAKELVKNIIGVSSVEI